MIDPTPPPLLEIRDLAVSFDTGRGDRVQAVDGVDLTVERGTTLAVVGESGCGKSVTALTVLGLIPSPPCRVDRGSIRFEGRELLPREDMDGSARRAVRGRDIAMIFQEPMSSLNPVMTIGAQLVEAIRLHQGLAGRAAWERAAAALHAVGVPRPGTSLRAYPHEFSGGMCQRAMIAMALACQPRLLIADEPTTALDVTIQAQILELLAEVRRERDMGLLLITHDLGVVARIADMVCVMYAGRVVEYASREDLFARPSHPYTRGLFSSIPRLHEPRRRLRTVAELVADPAEFTRLPAADLGLVAWWPEAERPEDAASDEPALVEVDRRHWVACWRTGFVRAHPVTAPA